MGKLFRKTKLSDNSFEAAPGGRSGTLTYQTPYGTPKGGNTVQDPRHFASSDKPKFSYCRSAENFIKIKNRRAENTSRRKDGSKRWPRGFGHQNLDVADSVWRKSRIEAIVKIPKIGRLGRSGF